MILSPIVIKIFEFSHQKKSQIFGAKIQKCCCLTFPSKEEFRVLEQEENSLLTLVAIFQIETHTLDAFSESSERQLSLKMCSATTTAPLAFVD